MFCSVLGFRHIPHTTLGKILIQALLRAEEEGGRVEAEAKKKQREVVCTGL